MKKRAERTSVPLLPLTVLSPSTYASVKAQYIIQTYKGVTQRSSIAVQKLAKKYSGKIHYDLTITSVVMQRIS